MSYKVIDTIEGVVIYGDGKRSCIGIDRVFQQWLRKNKDTLPNDIKSKVDDGSLKIEDAD
mgnify:FL=1